MASNVGTVNVNIALGRCKDCKWWGESVGRDYLKHFEGMRTCNRTTDGPAQAVCGIDHDRMDDVQSGNVATGPEFGCIHYEGKS